MPIAGTMKSRAAAQAASNTDTTKGRITRVYTDASGNITGADVLIDGQTTSLKRVTNSSGLRLTVGSRVTINYSNGSRLAAQIIGVAGAAGSAAVAAAAASATAALLGGQTDDAGLSGIPFLLEGPDSSVDTGYVLLPGANTAIESIAPDPAEDGGSSSAPNGQLIVGVAPLVLTALPDAVASGLAPGTVVDLVNSYGEPRGMYRLDRFGDDLIWRRRDPSPPRRLTIETADYDPVAGTGTRLTDIEILIVPPGSVTLDGPGIVAFTFDGGGS